MAFWRDIMTGRDGVTFAIGRAFGLVLLGVGIGVIPAEVLTVRYDGLTIEQWGSMLAQWQVFLPILAGVAGGLIAGTAFTEPKAKDTDDGNGGTP